MDVDHVFPQAPKRRANPRDVKKVQLNNAKLLSFEYPETFDVPSATAIKRATVGDWVKVSTPQERLWVQISGFEGRKWFGQVANDLITSDLKLGDTIQFYRKNIYDVEYR